MHQESSTLRQHQAVNDAHDGVDRVWIGALAHASAHAYRVPLRAKVSPVHGPTTVRVAHFQVFIGSVTRRGDHLDVEADAGGCGLCEEAGVSTLEHRDELAIGGLNIDRQAAYHDRSLAPASLSRRRHQVYWTAHDRRRTE